MYILSLCVDFCSHYSTFPSLCSLDTCETQRSPLCTGNNLCFTSCCWNQHLGALCGGLMKSFMLWLNQMIRGWPGGASKRNLRPQERRIKQVCDSVITDRTAKDYRPSAALSSYWCRHRHKDVMHINMLEVRVNTACTILQTIYYTTISVRHKSLECEYADYLTAVCSFPHFYCAICILQCEGQWDEIPNSLCQYYLRTYSSSHLT